MKDRVVAARQVCALMPPSCKTRKTWMAGINPAMTAETVARRRYLLERDDIGLSWCHIDGPPLPLWERSDRIERCDPGEGFVSANKYPSSDRDPSSGADFRPRHLLPQGEKEEVRGQTDSIKNHHALDAPLQQHLEIGPRLLRLGPCDV